MAGMKGLRTKDSRGKWPHEIRLEETAEVVSLLLHFMYKQAAGQRYNVEEELDRMDAHDEATGTGW